MSDNFNEEATKLHEEIKIMQLVTFEKINDRLVHNELLRKKTDQFKNVLKEALMCHGTYFEIYTNELNEIEQVFKVKIPSHKKILISFRYQYNAFQDAWILVVSKANLIEELIYLSKDCGILK